MTDVNLDVPPDVVAALTLSPGSHYSPRAGLCAMEAVAWLAREPHSDFPNCACPVLARFAQRLNDCASHVDRALLLAALPALLGTRSDEHRAARVRCLLVNTVRRLVAPALARHDKLKDHAAALAAVADDIPFADLRALCRAASAYAAYAYAAYAAYAYAAYAYAAYAAAAAADDDAAAAAAADAAAYATDDDVASYAAASAAASAAAAAYAARTTVYRTAVAILIEAARLGPHSDESWTPALIFRAQELRATK